MSRACTFSWCAVALWVASAAPGLAAGGAESSIAWLAGRSLARQLATPVDVFWSGTPLRHAITSLSRSRRVAVLIDRRVDPGQKLELRLSGLPLEQVFREIAQRRHLGVSWLGPVAYLGPARVASQLRTLAELRREEVRRLRAYAGRRFLSPKRLRWEDFATPRKLLAELAEESGIEITGLDQVPHDLWAGADLPALSLVDRLTLIAAQFDLTFQIAADASAVALIPIPNDVAIVRSYPAGHDPAALRDHWAALVPQSQIELVGNQIFVRGLLEDHERIAASMRPARWQGRASNRRGEAESGDPLAQKRYTVREGKGQLGPVIEQLAAQVGLSLKIDREALRQAGISLQQPISFSVEDATLDELFEAVLAPAGCTFRRQGKVLEIRPAR